MIYRDFVRWFVELANQEYGGCLSELLIKVK